MEASSWTWFPTLWLNLVFDIVFCGFSILKYLRMLHCVFSQVCSYMEPQALEKPCLLVQWQKNVASNSSALRYILRALWWLSLVQDCHFLNVIWHYRFTDFIRILGMGYPYADRGTLHIMTIHFDLEDIKYDMVD